MKMKSDKWVKTAVKTARASAKRRMGAGWDLLSPTMRRAMVCHDAMATMQHIDTEEVSGDTARRLIAVCEGIFAEDYE